MLKFLFQYEFCVTRFKNDPKWMGYSVQDKESCIIGLGRTRIYISHHVPQEAAQHA